MRDAMREHFPYVTTIDTRWMDNDVYGHVNNVVYYSLFDTVVNRWLMQNDLLDVRASAAIGLVVETGCQYFSPLSFPEVVAAGLRVARIGTSSIRYELALFRDQVPAAAAAGHFVHVYVDRETRRPVPIPPLVHAALQALRIA